ncbi:hypothetical protein I8751_05015 [Nostocaceae cyanobacterium CENA357]|uniref:Uncharacterized protein n=1 Tax=Atlanticothrix silvestris CENA357 TaxID=1725252 RepID=A0A8J7H8L4_9CYAN|nr:DUF6544 family protein [Atlanticothrix silvestris]MBH8551746.1 hypothetical protein [Atlanticothrix silvestris CENA357]
MFTKIFFGIGALLAIAFIILVIIRVRNEQEIDRIWRSLESSPTGDRFTEDMVAELPPPVQRYFLHSIAPGTPLASSVSLEMSGSFRMAQDKPWIPMRAKQITSALKGFVWKAVIGSGLFKFMGADYYANKSGQMRFALWGLIPLVNVQNPDITRSAIGRFVGEFFWLPSALLLQRNVTWKEIDDKTIQASLKVDGEPVTLTMVTDIDGKLLKVSFPRWGEHTEDGSYTYIPFGGEFQEEHTFGGFTIPSQISAGWWFGTERYSEFFLATIEQAEFC